VYGIGGVITIGAGNIHTFSIVCIMTLLNLMQVKFLTLGMSLSFRVESPSAMEL
jgi:hypothetical protein